MSVSGFEEFADGLTGIGRTESTVKRQVFNKVAILGGGEDGQLLAALALAAGAQVTLFSAYGSELSALRQSGGVTLRGDGPIGTYQVDQSSTPSIKTTAELDTAVADADAIFLTGPVHKQRTYSMVLADHVRDGQVLVLAPGRTFGAAETAWLLKIGGRRADVTIVEAQALPFWTNKVGNTLHLSQVGSVKAATLPANRSAILNNLLPILPNLDAAVNTLHSSFADGSALVEVPALFLGGPSFGDGMPQLPQGGVALNENRNFRTLIGDHHVTVMEELARERANVARAFGVRELPDLEQWLDIHAGSADGGSSRAVPQKAHAAAIVRCATLGSLVPLASAGRVAGRATPTTDAMIALAATILDADIANAGRKLETIGINADSVEDARRILDTIAKGQSDG